MSQPKGAEPSGRETRLLLATIAVSVAVLVLLARFRFPQENGQETATPAPAPLERLAASATYEELAAVMADLERRLAPRLTVVRVQPERPSGSFSIAPRLTPTRAVALLGPGETLLDAPVVGLDRAQQLAVLDLPEDADSVVTSRSGPPRPGPRYVALVEGTALGPVVKPVYVARTDLLQDERTNSPYLQLSSEQPLPRGAAIFSLTGTLIGVVSDGGPGARVIPPEALRAAAETVQAGSESRGDLGVDVQALSPALARAAGAQTGVMINYVDPRGPSARLLESGDTITAIDGVAVTTTAGFQDLAQGRAPGTPATLRILRGGKPLEVKVTPRDATARPLAPLTAPDPGMVLRPLADLGTEVAALRPGGAAAHAGLAVGDIIVRMDGRSAPSPADLLRTYREARGGSALLLTVQRGGEHLVLALEKP
jgi:serine protease Do